MKRVAVAGAGAWGTALANVMAAAGHPVTLWTRDAAQAAALAGTRANPHYLPGIRLHVGIRPTAALADLAEEGVRRVVEDLEKKNGGAYEPRAKELTKGRPPGSKNSVAKGR